MWPPPGGSVSALFSYLGFTAIPSHQDFLTPRLVDNLNAVPHLDVFLQNEPAAEGALTLSTVPVGEGSIVRHWTPVPATEGGQCVYTCRGTLA